MEKNIPAIGKGIILLFLLFAIPFVHAQDYSDIVSFFNNQFIPVEEITVESGAVTVNYSMEKALGPEEFGEDMLYIFGKVTNDFPDSNTILIDCFAGEDIIFEYEISTRDVLDYVNGILDDEEIISRIKITDFVSVKPGLTFESRSKPGGSSVQIPLTLEGIQENIGNIDMTLRYDPSVLEATGVIKGGLTVGSISDHNILSDGTVKVSLADSQGFSGDGSIAYVKFNVVGAEGTSCPLNIEALAANRASDYQVMEIPAIDGVFRVISVEEGRGDSDGDSELTALDALYALQMAVDKIPEDLAMDMNQDGSVTSLDARKILKIAVGSENK
jgi:hypothetical protein